MTAMTSKSVTRNGNNGSIMTSNNANEPDKNGEQETTNLITIEATEDMIKVESHQL